MPGEQHIMRKLTLVLVACVLCAVASAQVLGDIVKTSINFDKDRYARGTLATGSTVTRDAFGNVVVMPARVDFYWTSAIRGLTYIGSLNTTNGRTNIGDLNFKV